MEDLTITKIKVVEYKNVPGCSHGFTKYQQEFIENILNYVKHKITNAFAEGINSKIQHIKATARGFRNFENYKTSILIIIFSLNPYKIAV